MKKVDSSVRVDRRAVQAPLAMTEKRRFCVKKILGIAVGLWELCKLWGGAMRDRQTRRRILGFASNAQNLTSKQKILRFVGTRKMPKWCSLKKQVGF